MGPMLMLAAFLLNVSEIDHWTDYFGWTGHHEAAEASEEADPLIPEHDHEDNEVHAGHCHLNPATCSSSLYHPDKRCLGSG